MRPRIARSRSRAVEKRAGRAQKVFRFAWRRCAGRAVEAVRAAGRAFQVGAIALNRPQKFAWRAPIWNCLQWVQRLLKRNASLRRLSVGVSRFEGRVRTISRASMSIFRLEN